MDHSAEISTSDPSLSKLEQDWKALQKSTEDLYAQLNDFPHSFQLHKQENLLRDQVNKVKGALLSALDVGYDTPLETARACNLLAYLYFQSGEPTEALRQTDLVLKLEGQHQNLVSIANKAVILWHMEQRSEALEQVTTLKDMKAQLSEFPYLRVKANAELAFSYTCFDPRFYPLAQTQFEEVIPKALEPECCLWKFGLALTRRRLLRGSIKGGSTVEDFQSVLTMYMEIIQRCPSERLKAKAYAEMALLLFMPISEDLKIILEKQAGMSVDEACKLALEFDGNDNSVLWKCGKLYRYLQKTDLSCTLLEKAVSMRPRSKPYHHLGLTYKALATREKHQNRESKNEDTSKDNIDPISGVTFQRFQAQLSRSVSSESQSCSDQEKLTRKSSESEQDTQEAEGNGCTKEDKELSRTPSSESSCQVVDKSTKETFQVWKIVKSASYEMTQFNRGDSYVDQTIQSLSKAVESSEWENAAAIHDIVLMFRCTGELEQARDYLQRSLVKEHCLGIFTKINVYEQLGLVSAEMAKASVSQEDSKRLTEESQSMMLMALKTASESYANAPANTNHIRDVWQSFPALMEAVDENMDSPVRKLNDKARLCRLIRNNQKSLDILQEIKKMDPQKGNDPAFLQQCIENYVEMDKFEDALVFVDLLQCTSQHEKAMELFEDKDFLQKVYLQAGMQSLQKGSPNFRSHFRAVFHHLQQHHTCTSSEDTDTEEDKGRQPTWDVHLLHEDTAEDTDMARKVTSLLTEVCALSVTCMDEDALAGFHLEGVLNIMRRSKMVVVMVTSQQKLSNELHYFINVAARWRSSVSLLVNGGSVPRLMKTHRSMELSPQLMSFTGALDPAGFSPQTTAAICRLLGFLAGMQSEDCEMCLRNTALQTEG